MGFDFSNRNILIFQQRGWGVRIGHHLAARLQELGAQLAALTFKPSTDEFTRSQREVKYERIDSHDAVMGDSARFLNGTRHSLSEICDELGVQSVWPFAQSLRNHVRTYKESYYYSYRQNVSDEGIELYMQAAFELCRRLLDEFKPDLVIAPNFVALPHIFMRLLTDRHGIPMFAVTDTKVRGVLTFTHSHLDDRGPFLDRLRELESGAESPNFERSAEYLASNREQLLRPTQMDALGRGKSLYTRSVVLARLLKRSLAPRNRVAIFGPTVDSRTPRLIIRDTYRQWDYTRHVNSMEYDEVPAERDFAFFPLQFQPEESLDVIAPLFNNQIETARQIAMSLPGDMTLVVKEHPAMVGLRKPSYLEKVARTPNVKLVDYRIPSEQLLRHATLLIAPVGTVFAEAAILNLPAVQLGGLGTTRQLPNVVHHTDMSTLGGAIEKAMALDTRSEEYEQRLANYVAAAYDAGFELDYFGLWDGTHKEVRDSVIEEFVGEAEKCLRTLHKTASNQ